MSGGLTRFAYHLMDRNISLTAIHTLTAIPVPTLSMYANGHRSISANHRPLIATILDLPTDAIIGYCTTEIIIMTTPTPVPPYDQDKDPDPPPTPEPPSEPSHPPVPDAS